MTVRDDHRAAGVGPAGYAFHMDLAAGLLGKAATALNSRSPLVDLATAHVRFALAALQAPDAPEAAPAGARLGNRWVRLPPDTTLQLANLIAGSSLVPEERNIMLVLLADWLRSLPQRQVSP